MGVPYQLSEGEQIIVCEITKCREENNRNLVDRKQTDTDSYANRLNSYGAEMAVCALLNRYPDMSVRVNPGNFDLFLPEKWTVDVKWSDRRDANLIAYKGKVEKRCDVYILVVGVMPDYDLLGWCWGHELFKEVNIKQLRADRTPPYFLAQSQLRPFTTDLLNAKWQKIR